MPRPIPNSLSPVLDLYQFQQGNNHQGHSTSRHNQRNVSIIRPIPMYPYNNNYFSYHQRNPQHFIRDQLDNGQATNPLPHNTAEQSRTTSQSFHTQRSVPSNSSYEEEIDIDGIDDQDNKPLTNVAYNSLIESTQQKNSEFYRPIVENISDDDTDSNLVKTNNIPAKLLVKKINKQFETDRSPKQSTSTATEYNNTDTVAPRANRLYKCRKCDDKFRNSFRLTKHMIEHHGKGKLLPCKFCPKKFIYQSILVKHMRIHTGEKPHSCKICPRAFNTTTGLTQHMGTHTKEKFFSCEICSKAFNTYMNLKKHAIIHTEKKTYICNICDKAFKTAVYLKKHKKTNTHRKKQKEISSTF